MDTFMTMPMETIYTGVWAIVITTGLVKMLSGKAKRTPTYNKMIAVVGLMAGVFWLSTVGSYVTLV